MTNPLTCPFCADSANLIVDGEHTYGFWVFCCTCKASGPMAQDSDEAMIYWSQRHEENPYFVSESVLLS